MSRPTLRGQFDCSMSSRGCFHFRLFDGASRELVVEVSISPEQLALAMSGRAGQEVPFEPGRLERVGMKLETLSLSLPDKRAWNDGAGWRWDKDKARAAESRRVFRERMLAAALDLVPEEMRDGPAWELGTDGVGTQQNGDGWQMSLRRFIPATSND